MIELLLQAERALSVGMVDQAERLYRQAAEADPRNSIAVVGLARVALERADDREAYRQARRALAIDPENAAASRLVTRLDEVFAHRGETPPADDAAAVAVPAPEPATPADPAPATPAPPVTPPAGEPLPGESLAPAPPAAASVASPPGPTAPDPSPAAPAPRRGLVDRLFRRKTR
jgi:tetratricopeptide (TPR) repeat protein